MHSQSGCRATTRPRSAAPDHPACLKGDGEYRWAATYPCLYSTLIETALVRVRLDNGIEGWGEAQAPVAPEVACTIIERILRRVIAGEEFFPSPGAITRLWERMYRSQKLQNSSLESEPPRDHTALHLRCSRVNGATESIT